MEWWKDIPGYINYYQTSNYGRIRSLNRIVKHCKGSGLRTVKGRILKLRIDKDGHLRVCLSKLGIESHLYVHRLVLQTFIGPCPEGMECCHTDGNPANNRLENLRWDTRSNNKLDQVRHGTSPVGEKNGQAKLIGKNAVEILCRLESGEMQKNIAKDFGVSRSTISRIFSSKAWKHIKRVESTV